jgi:hypothetical protein
MERDLGHLHYRLMRLGHGHRRAVLLLWGWTFVLSALVLYPTFYPRWNAALPFAVALLAVALVTVFRPGMRRSAKTAPPVLGEGDADSPERVAVGALAGADVPGRPPVGATSRLAIELEDEEAAVLGSLAGGAHEEQVEGYRRAHRRRFARHHPPMRG